jgi:outer membrane lipoprotein-sorting protein
MSLPARSPVWIFALIGFAFSTAAMTARSQDGAPPAIVPARADPKARELMEEMLAAQRALKSYSATLEVVASEPRGVQKDVGVLAFKKPSRASVLTKGTKGNTRVVADGRRLFFAFPIDKNRYHKQMLSSRLSGVVQAIHRGVGKLLASFVLGSPLKAFTFVPSSIGPSDRVAGVSVETVGATLPMKEGREDTLTFAIGKRDHLLRRFTHSAKVNGQTGTQTATFSNVRANPPLPSAMFVFTPPPGAKAVSSGPASGPGRPVQ